MSVDAEMLHVVIRMVTKCVAGVDAVMVNDVHSMMNMQTVMNH